MPTKIWLYQTNRAVEKQEQVVLASQLDTFSAQWQAHGKNLHAKFWFHNPFLLICEVDESLWGASGCSIDAKVRYLKELGESYHLDFFVRMKTILRFSDQEFKQVDFSEVKTIGRDYTIFNPTIASSEELDTLFTGIEDAPMKRLFT